MLAIRFLFPRQNFFGIFKSFVNSADIKIRLRTLFVRFAVDRSEETV